MQWLWKGGLLSSGEPRALATLESLLGVPEDRHGDIAPRILSGVGIGIFNGEEVGMVMRPELLLFSLISFLLIK